MILKHKCLLEGHAKNAERVPARNGSRCLAFHECATMQSDTRYLRDYWGDLLQHESRFSCSTWRL